MSYADQPPPRVRVLVIDDDRDAAFTLCRVLELHGFEARAAFSGPDGVLAAIGWSPDVVLCDLAMSEVTGFEVAQALRVHPATAKARLIAVSAHDSEEARRRAREAGFEQHLVKPADLDVLLRLLSEGR